ncbi:SDR family oxidoreductase [Kineococcus sp. NBC_00420]|uniref:SDR family NAD(P)-dependent oxidoreductase n=1 Tax=Kineococcus sp. NBC_00420 TaxID=2903564 RepID=UPI002E1B33C2
MRLSDRFDLTGRTAVVTTGTGGVAGGCAHALGLAGARVLLAGGDTEEGEHLVKAMRADDIAAEFLHVEVTDVHDVERTLSTAVDRYGRVDVLVNAVDVRAPSAALDVTAPDWRRVVDGNLDTVWLWCQTFGRAFVAQRAGVIVNIGSTAGIIAGRPHWDHAAAASKAAVHHLTRSLAAEWAPFGVRVNAFAPGHVAADGAAVEDPRTRRHVLEDTPMERIATLEEITPAVVFLASDASSFTTGTVLVADGGYTTC